MFPRWNALGLLGALGLCACATVLPSAPPQQVVLQSAPPGAQVIINGEVRGLTPLVAHLPPREQHTVTFTLPGYDTYTQAIPQVACLRSVGTLSWPDECLVSVVDATLRPQGLTTRRVP